MMGRPGGGSRAQLVLLGLLCHTLGVLVLLAAWLQLGAGWALLLALPLAAAAFCWLAMLGAGQ